MVWIDLRLVWTITHFGYWKISNINQIPVITKPKWHYRYSCVCAHWQDKPAKWQPPDVCVGFKPDPRHLQQTTLTVLDSAINKHDRVSAHAFVNTHRQKLARMYVKTLTIQDTSHYQQLINNKTWHHPVTSYRQTAQMFCFVWPYVIIISDQSNQSLMTQNSN